MARPTLLVATLAALLLSACGGPSVSPIGEDPDDTAAGGPVDGCRPALNDEDPDPFAGAGGGQHPSLAGDWVGRVAEEVQTRHTDVLGGLWLDNDAGELVIMVPGTEGREVFEQLRQEAPEPDRVVCMEATYTEDELRELQEQVFERIGDAGMVAGGGTDTVRNRVFVDVETDLDEARSQLGDLADHAALLLRVPDCAEVVPPPEGATLLPGGGSTCGGMDALFTGTLAGDGPSGCAWFESDAGEPTAVLWPRGWSITEDGTIYDHHGEERARVGDRVDSGGGHVPLPEGQRACGMGGDEGAWLVNSLERAEEGSS